MSGVNKPVMVSRQHGFHGVEGFPGSASPVLVLAIYPILSAFPSMLLTVPMKLAEIPVFSRFAAT